jgi:F-type H+-transporting ATPase subunit a
MGLEFLVRVRRTTLWLSGVLALAIATYLAPLAGVALGLGAAWSLANLRLIEQIVVALTSPNRNTRLAYRRAGLAIAGMMGLGAIGAFLLVRLSPLWLAAGFTVPFAVLMFKAATILLLESRFWANVLKSPFRAALLAGIVLVAAWWMIDAGIGAARPNPTTWSSANAGAIAMRAQDTHVPAAEPSAEHGATAEHEGEAEESGPQKFPNVLTFLIEAAPHAPWAHFLHHYEPVIFSLLVGLILCVVAFFASRNPQMIPGPLQNGAEFAVEKLYNFIADILGPKDAAKYFPFLGTLFIYILCMNLFGLVLFMDSPTSNLNITFALGITVFVYVQYIGVRNLGVVGYVDHLLGQPRNLVGWLLVPLMLPIHLLGELAKPISLSCRLFGNIFGEDMLMVAFATLGIGMLSFLHVPFGIPMHAIFYPLALLTSGLQALVFTVLSTIYILLMLPHEEHEHEAGQHAH